MKMMPLNVLNSTGINATMMVIVLISVEQKQVDDNDECLRCEPKDEPNVAEPKREPYFGLGSFSLKGH